MINGRRAHTIGGNVRGICFRGAGELSERLLLVSESSLLGVYDGRRIVGLLLDAWNVFRLRIFVFRYVVGTRFRSIRLIQTVAVRFYGFNHFVNVRLLDEYELKAAVTLRYKIITLAAIVSEHEG